MNKLLFFLSFALCGQAYAFSMPASVNHLLDEDSLNLNYDFEGIVKLDNCSGSLVRFKSQPLSSKAYVLTNGHCIKLKRNRLLNPGEVKVDTRTLRHMSVFDRHMNLYPITAKKLVYATLTDTDIAIYELNQTYLDIEKYGVRSLVIDDNRPELGTEIDIVSGYWDRGYRCHIEKFIHKLKEGGWTFSDSLRFSETGCKTKGGTSGSPIILKGTRLVIAINNTGNSKGMGCGFGTPCEVNESGETQSIIRGYGQQTYQIYSCLNDNFEIDLSLVTCSLPK